MDKTILLTGSAGFIGFHISRALLERGDSVIGVDNFNNYYDPKLKEDRNAILEKYHTYKLYRNDICDKDGLEKIFSTEKIDAICHLAMYAGVRNSIENPNLYLHVNIEGTSNILELAREYSINNTVIASTSSVYGDNPIPWKEDQRVENQVNPYGVSKRAAELLAKANHKLYKLNITMLRYFSVYGPWGRPDMAYFKFADSITKEEPIDVYNNGKLRRDFTYIDDIVKGTISAIDKPQNFEIYNLGNHKSEELGYFIELIEKNFGKKAEKNYLPMQEGDFLENFADIEKAKKDLGFEPKTSLEEGLKNFVEWYKEYYKIC
ncbi:MAG: protein CapI [Parcubacteria group bacterium CG_4_9_14_0_2_um_filter_41_8]|nr:MAG: protein CapI [Parcubacteria group bacterium CG22_combo_CG10-13_8_21_14_all_41_9]PJC41037.1 MAG: protein CapI [Parcubacteria group bacterium CG_4_9_14_0_2_um_filter_41_8]